MRFSFRTLTLFVVTTMASKTSSSSIVSECNTRLPMSLSTVISDLEAEGISRVVPICFLTSRGVTEAKKAELFGLEDLSTTSFGTNSGICMALSTGLSSVPEAASTAVACEGNVVFYADEGDLERGEGLFDSLGPAMERILNQDDDIFSDSFSLIVLTEDPQTTKERLEDAAVDVLANLVSMKKKISVLSDVFERVQYVKTTDEAMNLLGVSKDPSRAQESIASTVASDFWQSTGSSPVAFISSSSANMSPTDLAAARKLGPAARKALRTAIETVKTVSEDNRSLVPNFRELCGAATKRALEELKEAAVSQAVSSSAVGKQIQANLQDELHGELEDLATGQFDLLQESCFDEFKVKLSSLKISPLLPKEMKNVARESLVDFSKRASKMLIRIEDAKSVYQNRLQEFCSERLLAARASGQFRPLPRKGVTIGMHWLLPKPFGNDYRQEPWMVHATDNLVYLPPDKITDVNPDEIASGDWRNKIVPSPAGNEMIYMQ